MSEFAVKAETREGNTFTLRRGFKTQEEAEDHPVQMSLWKRVWVEPVAPVEEGQTREEKLAAQRARMRVRRLSHNEREKRFCQCGRRIRKRCGTWADVCFVCRKTHGYRVAQ